jgi:hypothetical protein
MVWYEAWTVMIFRGLRFNAALRLPTASPYPDGFWGQRLPSDDQTREEC